MRSIVSLVYGEFVIAKQDIVPRVSTSSSSSARLLKGRAASLTQFLSTPMAAHQRSRFSAMPNADGFNLVLPLTSSTRTKMIFLS